MVFRSHSAIGQVLTEIENKTRKGTPIPIPPENSHVTVIYDGPEIRDVWKRVVVPGFDGEEASWTKQDLQDALARITGRQGITSQAWYYHPVHRAYLFKGPLPRMGKEVIFLICDDITVSNTIKNMVRHQSRRLIADLPEIHWQENHGLMVKRLHELLDKDRHVHSWAHRKSYTGAQLKERFISDMNGWFEVQAYELEEGNKKADPAHDEIDSLAINWGDDTRDGDMADDEAKEFREWLTNLMQRYIDKVGDPRIAVMQDWFGSALKLQFRKA